MNNRASMGFVFAIVAIDMLGFGIVAPVMPGLMMELGRVDIDTAALYSGWLAAGYAVMQFVFAPIIGNLSDRFGRRPVLLSSILAMAVDFTLMALAPNLWWLVAGRLVAGVTGASFTAAYAYIADITPPEQRAARFGMMGMAFGIGFILGPALGGLLAEWGNRAPFYAAAALAFGNFLFGLVFLKESLKPDLRRAFDIRRANALSALKALRGQSGTVLWFVAAHGTWQLAHIVYPAIWPYFAIEAYGFDERGVGLSLAMFGLTSALVQGVALRWFTARFGTSLAVMTGVTGLCLAAVLYVFAWNTPMVYFAIAVGSLQGFVGASINAMSSKAVAASSQGELQGAAQSVGSIAQIVGPPLYTAVFAAFSGPASLAPIPAMPLLLAGAIGLVTLVLFLTGMRRLPPESR